VERSAVIASDPLAGRELLSRAIIGMVAMETMARLAVFVRYSVPGSLEDLY
jgi:hypothetical protein